MTEDRTLEEFLPVAGSEPDAAETEADRSEEADGSTEGTDDDAATVTPATPTYGWGEYTCSECETTTERVWWDGCGPVCDGCKQW